MLVTVFEKLFVENICGRYSSKRIFFAFSWSMRALAIMTTLIQMQGLIYSEMQIWLETRQQTIVEQVYFRCNSWLQLFEFQPKWKLVYQCSPFVSPGLYCLLSWPKDQLNLFLTSSGLANTLQGKINPKVRITSLNLGMVII